MGWWAGGMEAVGMEAGGIEAGGKEAGGKEGELISIPEFLAFPLVALCSVGPTTSSQMDVVGFNCSPILERFRSTPSVALCTTTISQISKMILRDGSCSSILAGRLAKKKNAPDILSPGHICGFYLQSAGWP